MYCGQTKNEYEPRTHYTHEWDSKLRFHSERCLIIPALGPVAVCDALYARADSAVTVRAGSTACLNFRPLQRERVRQQAARMNIMVCARL